MRRLVDGVRHGVVHVLESAIQIATLLREVGKTNVCVDVAWLLLRQSLEYLSSFSHVFMLNAARQVEPSRDLERPQSQIITVTLGLERLAVGKRLFEHLLCISVLFGVHEEHSVVVEQFRRHHGLSELDVC